MQCNNIKCPHYKKPEKRDWAEKQLGVTHKQGGCKFHYCKTKRGGKR